MLAVYALFIGGLGPAARVVGGFIGLVIAAALLVGAVVLLAVAGKRAFAFLRSKS